MSVPVPLPVLPSVGISSSVASATDAVNDKSTSGNGQTFTTIPSQESVQHYPFDIIPWYGWLGVGGLAVPLPITLLFIFIRRRQHRAQRGR